MRDGDGSVVAVAGIGVGVAVGVAVTGPTVCSMVRSGVAGTGCGQAGNQHYLHNRHTVCH